MFKITSETIKTDRIEYECIEAAYDELRSYGYIKDMRPLERSAREMLTQVLQGTRWTTGYIAETGNLSTNFYYITVLEAVQKITSLFNLEVTFDVLINPRTQQITGREVNLYSQQGERTGKRFEYGSNLLTIEREENTDDLVTALVGRGKGELVSEGETETDPDGYGRRITFADVVWSKANGDPADKPAGQEYVEDTNATALYGFDDGTPRIGLTIFENIEDPEELLRATWSALQEAKRPKVSFKAKTTDVGDLGLGDTVAIIRHDLQIEYFTRVYKVTHDLQNKNNNVIELGDDFSERSLTNYVAKVEAATQIATENIDRVAVSANGKNKNYYGTHKPPVANEGDNLFLDLGNGETEHWVWHHGQWEFISSTQELHQTQKEVEKAQAELSEAKQQIADNKKMADQDIDRLNQSIIANKNLADESLQKLNDSMANLQGLYDNNIVPDLDKVTKDVATALQQYTTAQNNIADLQKQAQEQGQDIASVTATVNGLNVNYANLQGDVNTTKADVKGLQTTLGTANGDIAQLKLDAQNLQTLLAGKVDSTTYTNFVNLTNQALAAKLTASDLNGYAKTVDVQATADGLRLDMNSVSDRLNNMVLGSTNLLHNTSNQYRDLSNSSDWLQKSTASDVSTSTANYHNGDQFTYAATVNNTSSRPVVLEVWLMDENKQGLNGKAFYSESIPVGAVDQRVSVTFSITSDTRYIRTWLIFQNAGGKPGDVIQVKDERLVLGEYSNTWLPNPEDTEHDLTELSARITANTQQFSSYYTKSETDSKANTAKNDAINAIKGDSNWTGLTNIITNSGFLQTADGFIQKVQQTTLPMFNGGGVNLLTDTYDYSKNWTFDNIGHSVSGNVLTLTNTNGTNSRIYQGLTVESYKKVFSLSFYAKIAPGCTDKDIKLRVGPYNGAKEMHVTSTSSTLYKLENWTWKGGSTTFSFYVDNGKIDIANLKLEYGSVATPWSPNPNDLATQVAFTELSQSLEELRSTVSGNYGQLQNIISQTDTATRNELINQITGVQNQITTTANGLNLTISNLQIGSRNLLHNTSDKYKTLTANGWGWLTTASSNNTAIADFKKGTAFTYATTISNNSAHAMYLEIQQLDVNNQRISAGHRLSAIIPTGAKNMPISVTANKVDEAVTIQTYIIVSEGEGTNDQIQVKDERLVEGSYPGSWSPNPDDMATSQSVVDLNATLQGLQNTVSSNYGALQSLNSQTVSTIRSEVNDYVNNLQGQITTQANMINLQIGTGGDLSNLCHNPNFNDGSVEGWDGITASSGNGNSPTKYYGHARNRDNYYGSQFSVAVNDKFYFSIFAWPDTSNYNFALGLQCIDNDGKSYWYKGVSFSPSEKFKTKTGSFTIPAGVVKARIWVQIDATSDFGHWYFTNVVVKKNDTLAQINMSAGTTLIQNDRIYMDASSTVFSGNAFIPSAAITSLNADKITTGTLNAANVNIINLDVDHLTGNITNFIKSYWESAYGSHVTIDGYKMAATFGDTTTSFNSEGMNINYYGDFTGWIGGSLMTGMPNNYQGLRIALNGTGDFISFAARGWNDETGYPNTKLGWYRSEWRPSTSPSGWVFGDKATFLYGIYPQGGGASDGWCSLRIKAMTFDNEQGIEITPNNNENGGALFLGIDGKIGLGVRGNWLKLNGLKIPSSISYSDGHVEGWYNIPDQKGINVYE